VDRENYTVKLYVLRSLPSVIRVTSSRRGDGCGMYLASERREHARNLRRKNSGDDQHV